MSRGGPRPGAGRKPDPNAAHRKLRPILLNDEELDRAKAIGEGNASLGVRLAVAYATETQEDYQSWVQHLELTKQIIAAFKTPLSPSS